MATPQIKVNPISVKAPAASPFTSGGSLSNADSNFKSTAGNPLFKMPSMSEIPKVTEGIAINGGYNTTTPVKTAPVQIPKPTPVVSSNTAATKAKTVIQPVLTAQQQAQADAQAKKANTDTLDSQTQSTDKFLLGSKSPNPNYTQPSTDTSGTTQTPTVEDHLANEALHPGQTQLYNQATGAQDWVSPGTPGYGSENPLTKVAKSSVDIGNGVTYKKYADGTYARFNANTGTYSQATAGDYSNAQQQSIVSDKINSIINGSYVLSPNEQSQINSIKSTYSSLISKQQTENANITGGMTIAQNMYGMGNTLIGQGEIHQTVIDGLDRIKATQDELSGKVAQMTEAFKKDDMALLQQSYDDFTKGQQQISVEIDSTQAKLQAQQYKMDAQQSSVNESMAKKYTDTTSPILPTDSADDLIAKLKTSPRWQDDQTVAASLTPEEDKFMGEMAVSGVSLSNMFPSLGIGKAAVNIKIGIMKSLIDNAKRLGLSGQELATSMLDKQAKAKSIIQLQNRGGQLAAQEIKVENDFNLVKKLGQKVDEKTIQGAAPFIQQWINTGTVATTGNPALNNWMGALTTTLTAYARVVSGSTGSAATTEGMNTEIQAILRKGLSTNTINEYIDNTAKPEMKNTLTGFNSSIQQLMDGMNQADGTTTAGGLGITAENNNAASAVQTNPDGTLKAVNF